MLSERWQEADNPQSLLECGFAVRAWHVASQNGVFPDDRDANSLVLAARLLWQIGAPVRSRWTFRRAWQRFPDHPLVLYYRAHAVQERFGFYAAWRFLQDRQSSLSAADDELRASWFALLGSIAAALRDFDAAEHWLEQARTTKPDSPWVDVSWAHLYEAEDRYDAALEAAQRALTSTLGGTLRKREWYRPAVQAYGHLLTLCNRDDEAVDFLWKASNAIESAPVAAQCYALLMELDRFDEAVLLLDRCEQLSPLKEKRYEQWLVSQRANLAFERGDVDAAIELWKQLKSPYYRDLVERLSQIENRCKPRVRLDVPFVRQHHVTCVPATLTAVSRFWSMPVDHVQLAEEICYDGTSAHSERNWANRHGWLTREFTVTETAAQTLLDRGVPFTLTTVAPSNSHLQAITGYDARCGTLQVRDPYLRHSGEALAGKFLAKYASTGPRGMALVPLAESHRIETLELPDAPLWDLLHAVDGELIAHRREAGGQIVERLESEWPDHWLAWEARRRLAAYDADPIAALSVIERQLQRSPDDERLLLNRLACMRDISCRDDRIAVYQRACSKRNAHPLFFQQYAHELRSDARQHTEAMDLLRRAIRLSPLEPSNYAALASLLWDQRRRSEACELFRFAACLDDKDEDLAINYFTASQGLARTDESLEFLRRRFQRFGAKSSLPAKTLHLALIRLERTTEALAVLDQALERRPEDGELLLFTAHAYLAASLEFQDRATALLERASGRASRSEWLRYAAQMAAIRGASDEAIDYWRELLEQQPFNINGHTSLCRLLCDSQGIAAVLEHLELVTSQFPTYQPLAELRCEWLQNEPAQIREPIARQLLELFPESAWARRELGFILGEQRRLDEARAEYEVAARLAPEHGATHLLQAFLYQQDGRLDDAREALQNAIRVSVDNDSAINGLMQICNSQDERRGALEFVRQELQRQVIFGDGLLAYRNHARQVLDAEQLLKLLQEALKSRPDLWHAWSANVQQLLEMNRLSESWDLARQATERFPLLARLWLDQAHVCRAREDWTEMHAALEAAYRIHPGWVDVVSELKDARLREGDIAGARRLIETALARDPRNSTLKVTLAELSWTLQERETAMRLAAEAAQIEPGNDAAWQLLRHWSQEMGYPDRALTVARDLARDRPHEPRSWLVLAQMLAGDSQVDESLIAVQQALELNPRSLAAHEVKVQRLAEAGRFSEALEACRPAAWSGSPPMELLIAEARIYAQQADLRQAVELLRAALAAESNNHEGWKQLADWYQSLGDTQSYLDAAREMVRIAPHHDVSLGYLGEALSLNGNHSEARAAYQHAFELNPSYVFAGLSVFDMHLANGELPAARAILDQIKPHDNSPYVLTRELQYAIRTQNRHAAIELLPKICTTECPTTWPISQAIVELAEAGWSAQALSMLDTLLDDPHLQPEVYRQWGALIASGQDSIRHYSRFETLAERGESGCLATYGLLETYAKTRRSRDTMHFIRNNWAWMTRHTLCWGSAGYALAELRDYSEVAQRMHDWRQRSDAKSWMLVNAVEGLRAVGLRTEAVAASLHALQLADANGSVVHKIWLAADQAIDGDIETAKQYLHGVESAALDDDYRFLFNLVMAITRVHDAPLGEKGRYFNQAYKELALLPSRYPQWRHEPARRKHYIATLKRLAMLRGGAVAKLRYWLRRLTT